MSTEMSAAYVMHTQWYGTLVETLFAVRRAGRTTERGKRRDDQFRELRTKKVLRSENDAEPRYTPSGRGKAKSDTKERKPDPMEPEMTRGGDPWMYGLAPCAHECSKDEPKKPCPACDWMADLHERQADLGSIFKIRPLGYHKPRSLFPATVVQFPKSKKKRKLLQKKQLIYCPTQMGWRWVLKDTEETQLPHKDQN